MCLLCPYGKQCAGSSNKLPGLCAEGSMCLKGTTESNKNLCPARYNCPQNGYIVPKSKTYTIKEYIDKMISVSSDFRLKMASDYNLDLFVTAIFEYYFIFNFDYNLPTSDNLFLYNEMRDK